MTELCKSPPVLDLRKTKGCLKYDDNIRCGADYSILDQSSDLITSSASRWSGTMTMHKSIRGFYRNDLLKAQIYTGKRQTHCTRMGDSLALQDPEKVVSNPLTMEGPQLVSCITRS